MIALNLHNETNTLEAVVLGLPDNFGGTPTIKNCYDPKSKEHVLNGTFPTQQNVINEMNAVKTVLLKYDVEVFRPNNIKDLNQIFSRDIGFVIEDKFIIPNTFVIYISTVYTSCIRIEINKKNNYCKK